MAASVLLFYSLAALVLITGFLTVTSKKFFRAAIYLLASLLFTSGIYFLLSFSFIAVIQIMVYVGGIVVLILFSILLTQNAQSEMKKPKALRTFGGLILAGGGFGYFLSLILSGSFRPSNQTPDTSMINIGRKLLSTGTDGFILPFEVVTILLLAAMIGSIVIAYKAKEKTVQKI